LTATKKAKSPNGEGALGIGGGTRKTRERSKIGFQLRCVRGERESKRAWVKEKKGTEEIFKQEKPGEKPTQTKQNNARMTEP